MARSCQRNITRILKNRGNEEYRTRKECFESLATYVRNSLIGRGKFSTMGKVSNYEKLQTEKNVTVKGVAHEFEEELLFYQENIAQSEFVYHKSVPIKENERCWFVMSIEEKVTKTAEIIRE